jgi:DNA-directed RNA polymerase specialized sigma24 family protein
MSQLPNQHDSEILPEKIHPGMDEVFDRIATGLYSLAALLVGEGEESMGLVEAAVTNAETSICLDPTQERKTSRRALVAAALDLLAKRSSESLAAPLGLTPASICIEDDDLASAGISSEELEKMISGPERDLVRKWLAGLPEWMRTVFVLRAVAGLNTAETTGLLQTHGGPQAAAWTPETVREVFRQGLCSLASQLLQASAVKYSL